MDIHINKALTRDGEPDGAAVFSSLFKEYYASLCFYATRFLDEQDEAKDAVSAVFLRIWQNRSYLEKHTNLKALLYTSVRNQCLNILRNKQFRDQEKEKMKKLAEDDDGFYRSVMKNEMLREIYREIESLPEQCKKVFKGLYLLGLTPDEVAKELGIAKRTVFNHQQAALKNLRKKIFPEQLFTTAVAVGTAALIALIVLLVFCLEMVGL